MERFEKGVGNPDRQPEPRQPGHAEQQLGDPVVVLGKPDIAALDAPDERARTGSEQQQSVAIRHRADAAGTGPPAGVDGGSGADESGDGRPAAEAGEEFPLLRGWCAGVARKPTAASARGAPHTPPPPLHHTLLETSGVHPLHCSASFAAIFAIGPSVRRPRAYFAHLLSG